MNYSFDKIAGYANEKKEMQEVCKVLQNVDKFKKLGLRMPKGIMLIGEPGVGKTAMAESIINESHVNCVRIVFDAVEEEGFSEYLDNAFKEAVKKAPCIIFMDELDKACGEESPFRSVADMTSSRKVLKAINDNESNELMLLATVNDEDMLHPALKRSGRFDRVIKIPKPSFEDRKAIVEYYAQNKAFDKKVNFTTLAKITGGFTGADIECVMNESGLNAVINDRETIIQEDIDKAVNRIIFQSCEREASVSKDSKNVVAVHETGHLIAGLLLDENSVGSVSILPQGESTGHVKIGMECKSVKTIESVLNTIVIGMSGKAAEKVVFPDMEYLNSSSDIARSVKLARRLVSSDCCYGFEYFTDLESERMYPPKPTSQTKVDSVEKKTAEIVDECFEKAKKLITDNIELVKKFAKIIEKRYSLTREEILKIYNKEKKRV